MLFFSRYLAGNLRKMSTFVQKINPVTGANDWIVQNENYDFHQEVARASFADMLHDTERNQLYEKALKSAINKTHDLGKKAIVLDIGTGTGLLSMMAARNGADEVIACEAFKPMSECANKIIALNNLQGKIKVIPKRSTELTVGETGDLITKCNILVTEVFDTELIGEGALSTFSHAHKHLLEKDSIVVPNSATIFAQVVECPLTQNWNKLKDIYNDDGEILIRVPESIQNCAGSASVHDIQLSQLPLESINTIISPLPVLRFDWSGKTPFILERSTINTVKAERSGRAQAVFMWWELQMDTEGQFVLSCAPHWAHGSKNGLEIPWRDHWMQAVYYLPKEIPVNTGQEINLISCHDEYSLWFNLTRSLKLSDSDYSNPRCECGVHVSFSRTRIGQMSDTKRNKKYMRILEEHVTKDSSLLVLSDGFYCGLVASKLGAKKVSFLETNHLSRQILHEFVKYNNLNNVEVIPNLDSLKEANFKDVSIVLGEPYFVSSILPWDNLLFMFLITGIKRLLPNDVEIFPRRAVIKAVAVHFNDLYKIRSPLGTCEGFLMKPFDDLIQESSDISDDNVEAQPLWEYPGIALSAAVEIVNLDLLHVPDEPVETSGCFDMKGNLDTNGIALWVEWHLDDSSKHIITTGPTIPVEIGQRLHWDMHVRQGVHLFPSRDVQSIQYNFRFDFTKGDISFKFR